MSGENTQLSEDKQEFIRLVKERIYSKLLPYELAILIELEQPAPKYDELFSWLRSQQSNNDLVMNGILGMDASELLEKIIP